MVKPSSNLDDRCVATKASGKLKEQEYRVNENDDNGNKCLWFSSSLAKKKKSLALSLTSRRVRIPSLASMINMFLRSQWTQQVMSRV